MIQQNRLDLFTRHSANPILQASDWPYPINSVFNPGATILADGTTLLLCRVEDRRGHSHFCAARSANGIDTWQIDAHPTFAPDPQQYPEEQWGIEDPRITYLEELAAYAVVYTSYATGGPGVSLATTTDFKTFTRYGVVMQPENKDAALFPVRINGLWAMIHRPIGAQGSHIWMSFSPDLRHWGQHQCMLEARKGAWWDANKIGLSPPPIATEEGWLLIYHGVRITPGGCLYRLGVALFETDHPERCLRRGEPWVLSPHTEYERHGDVPNVIFPCGVTVLPDGDTLHVYYGAADSCIAVAIGSIRQILDWLTIYGLPSETPSHR